MKFIAFQQFEPREQKLCGSCIWCGQAGSTNRAHIISRKLATGARNAPTLRFSVCEECNSACGRLEEWTLRYTPLSWVRLMLYLHGKSEGTSRHIPSYFFSAVLNDWVIFHLDGRTRSYAVPTQLLLSTDFRAQLLTQASQDMHQKFLARMMTALRDEACTVDIRPSLPKDFSPRLLLDNEKIVLIARSESESERLSEHIARSVEQPHTAQMMPLENTGREHYHFQWSRANWARFCAKTALETLCLFEGGEKCLRPAFNLVREFVLRGTQHTAREIVFDKKGPLDAKDTPLPMFVDLTPGQNAPPSIPALQLECDPGMHIVTLYEIRGWVLASVVFAGFPPSVLVLGGPDEHLADLYQLIYDDQEASFDFARLAYDQSKPVIPLPVSADCLSGLAETYRLVAL